MANQITTSSKPPLERLSDLWQSLTIPSPIIVDEKERQKARFISRILLNSFTIFVVIATLTWLLPRPNEEWLFNPESTYFGILIIFISYLISRTRYYASSVHIFSYDVIFVLLFQFFFYQYTIMASLAVLIAPVFSGLISKPKNTALTGFFAFLFFTLCHFQFGNEADAQAYNLFSAIIIAITIISMIANNMREHTRQELEKTKDELQDQVILVNMAREEAERANRIKSAFLASMSHELRTPLNSIINFTRFVADGDLGEVNEGQKELLMDVVGSSKHLLALINDVLDMSKIEAGSLQLFIENDINIKALIHGAITTTRGLLNDKPVEMKVEVPDDLPHIQGDKQRILQILLNLLSNACKFTWDGEIKVRAYQENSEIIISVADTGPGIAPEDQVLVFESFRQTSAGLRQGGGTGLGMPIARNLAEAHGGRLWLESVLGKGATFYVALPLVVNR